MGKIRVMRYPDVIGDLPYNPWKPKKEEHKTPDDAAPAGRHRWINKAWQCDRCGKWHAKQDIVCPEMIGARK